jgi:hypothetical protein
MQNTDIFDKRLLVLLLLKEFNHELSAEQISNLCSEFEDITYIDICMFIDSLKTSGYIEEIYEGNKVFYTLAPSGEEILSELIELVPGINLLNIKNILKNTFQDYKQNYEVDTLILPVKDDEYKVSCYIKDGNDELINLTIYAGDKETAKNISTNWKDNADDLYGKIIELMTN